MARTQYATTRPASRFGPIAAIGFMLALAGLLALMAASVRADLPVEVPDVVAPVDLVATFETSDAPAVQANPIAPSSSTAVDPATSGPKYRVIENGDGRVLIQFEGLRPGVTAE